LRAPGTVLLDDARPEAGRPHGLLFTAPQHLLVARTLAEVAGVLAGLDAAVGAGYWVAGYLAYEAAAAFLPVPSRPYSALPLAWFGVYAPPQHLTSDDVDALLPPSPPVVAGGRFGLEQAAYHRLIDRIRHLIREGDVYQVNLTAPFTFAFEGDPLGLYGTLRRRQRVSYGAVLQTGEATVLSRSPELFFQCAGDRLWTRPMKGTVRRGRTCAEDTAQARWLQQDAKSRAENLMIVDLLRNDLSVVCAPGSVQVPALFTIEPYETLLQMTSTVEGRLKTGVGYAELFQALFPCGSVTGAPKLRAMQRIHALEAAPRGVYCGAIGYAAPDQQAVFSVAIRTVVLHEGQGTMGTGSGVVWDSEAAAEYDECLLKTRFLTDPAPERQPFQLIETLCWRDGVALLERHLARMRDSAAYFGYPFDEPAFAATLAEAAAPFLPGTAHRLRLTLDAQGRFHATARPLEPPSAHPLRLTFSRHIVDPTDIFFFHKTTRRAFYEAALAEAQAAGFDEVLFVNDRGEVTEAARANLFIRAGDRWFTPPVACGLLGGVYRAHLLATLPNAAERILTPVEVQNADAVYLCNAVRGLMPAVLPEAITGRGSG
jgi:para-aminobenzoate synthetase/4-amino-4-deoxychorismate lyase